MRRGSLAWAAAAWVLACAPAGAAGDPPPVSYRCEDGTSLTASFRTAPAAPSVRLAIAGGRSVRLPQVLSADGGRYRLGAVEFWIKGQSATLTRKGTATVCNVS